MKKRENKRKEKGELLVVFIITNIFYLKNFNL